MNTLIGLRCLATVAALAMLAGCGGDAPDATATPVAAPGAAPSTASEFTAAVPIGATAAAAKVHFKLGSQPRVGQPLVIEFRVAILDAVQKVQFMTEPEPGLEFAADSTASFVLDATSAGAQLPHKLKVVPTTEGVLILKATVLTDVGGVTASTGYAIPLIVAAASPSPPG